MNVLLLCDDLIFASRITGTAAPWGLTVKICRSSIDLLDQARQDPPICVIVDLSHPGLNLSEFVAALKSAAVPPKIVAYGSHVDVAGLKAAREAGCDFVLPRSQFVERLPTALPDWARRS